MAAPSKSAGRASDSPASVTLHKYTELTKYLAATNDLLSELKRECDKFPPQTMGINPENPSKLRDLYKKFKMAKRSFNLEEGHQGSRANRSESEERAIINDIEILKQRVNEMKILKRQFHSSVWSQAQGDSSSEGGGGHGADAVTR